MSDNINEMLDKEPFNFVIGFLDESPEIHPCEAYRDSGDVLYGDMNFARAALQVVEVRIKKKCQVYKVVPLPL